MPVNLYKERDIEALGDFYCNHAVAMTAEGLHSKSSIAAELAWRDKEIVAHEEIGRASIEACKDLHKKIEELTKLSNESYQKGYDTGYSNGYVEG